MHDLTVSELGLKDKGDNYGTAKQYSVGRNSSQEG